MALTGRDGKTVQIALLDCSVSWGLGHKQGVSVVLGGESGTSYV